MPPSGGDTSNGGGGGGALELFYYYIPLIFNNSHEDGESSVKIWNYQATTLQTSFAIDNTGVNGLNIGAPTNLTFMPSTSPGLTNGSLIILSSPAQIIGERGGLDLFSDLSFSYTILPARMMGYEFKSPFDGFFSAFTTRANTTISSSNQEQPTVAAQNSQFTFPVQKGEYINSTQPLTVAFYSKSSTGTAAALGVPYFLQGSKYIFPADVSAPREDEVDQSSIVLLPEVPTEIYLNYKNGEQKTIEIFGITELQQDDQLNAITSARGLLTISFENVFLYGNISHRSSVTLIAAPEMRSGELFNIANGYSSHFAVINSNTNFSTGKWFETLYIRSARNLSLYNEFDTLSFGSTKTPTVIIANHSLFGIAVSPGYAGHPMSHSASFVLVPLNTNTIYRNITDVTATWYRFPNLAVESIELNPGSPEEFTGQTISVNFISNGSLPAGNFIVEISFLGAIQLTETVPFLRINKTQSYEFRIFLEYNLRKLNISTSIDVADTVSEINETDNQLVLNINVNQNIRILTTGILVLGIVLGLIIWRVLVKWKGRRKIQSSHYDAILTIEQEDV